MAKLKLVKSGAWATATTWENVETKTTATPTSADDCILAGAFTVKVEAGSVCRSITAETGATTAVNLKENLTIGGSTAAPENIAFKMVTGITFVGTALFVFKSSAGQVEKIFSVGRILEHLEWAEGKWKLEEALSGETTAEYKLTGGELNTNSQTIKVGTFKVTGTATLAWGTTGITLTGPGKVWEASEGCTFTGTSSLTITNTLSANSKVVESGGSSNGKTYALTITGQNVSLFAPIGKTSTVSSIALNDGRAPKKFTATGVKKEITVVSGETPEIGEEVTGAHIPAGTTITSKKSAIVFGLSAELTETVAVAEEVSAYGAGFLLSSASSTTLTGIITTNAKEGEEARLAATELTAAQLKKTSGTVSIDWVRIAFSVASGGASFFAGVHGVSVKENTGWKFEVAGITVSVPAAAVMASITAPVLLFTIPVEVAKAVLSGPSPLPQILLAAVFGTASGMAPPPIPIETFLPPSTIATALAESPKLAISTTIPAALAVASIPGPVPGISLGSPTSESSAAGPSPSVAISVSSTPAEAVFFVPLPLLESEETIPSAIAVASIPNPLPLIAVASSAGRAVFSISSPGISNGSDQTLSAISAIATAHTPNPLPAIDLSAQSALATALAEPPTLEDETAFEVPAALTTAVASVPGLQIQSKGRDTDLSPPGTLITVTTTQEINKQELKYPSLKFVSGGSEVINLLKVWEGKIFPYKTKPDVFSYQLTTKPISITPDPQETILP